MKKNLLFALFSVLLVLQPLCSALADDNPFCVVVGATSDRVHLRRTPDAASPSMGLYFTGTPVVVLEENHGQWMQVMIGAEKGYIYKKLLSPFLNFDTANNKWKQGTAKANGYINVRSAPTKQASVITTIQPKSSVAILGETVDHWYYIKTGDFYGYVMSQYVKISEKQWSEEKSSSIPAVFAGYYWFCSGAGA